MSNTSRKQRLGTAFMTLGILLMIIKAALVLTGTAGGGSPILTFSAILFVLLGVAFTFRSRSPQD